jgi:hypothetical protein
MGAYAFTASDGEPNNSMDTVRMKPGLLQGVVILATWRSLEPTADGGLAPNNEIDQGLAEVRKYNADYPNAPLTVKLRVWGGAFAPQWAIDASGGPVQVVHTNVNNVTKTYTVGHVWSDAYRQRWAHLQEMLAAKYDGEPLVHEVAVTSCQVLTAEPFFIDTKPAALDPLRAAGLTDATYKACLDGIPQDYAPWKTTRFETPLNPFRSTDSATTVQDVAWTTGWIDRCRKFDAARCVLDNHDLDAPVVNKDIGTLYDAMSGSGAEVEFQTYTTLPTDVPGTIQLAVDKGATSVELWQDYGGFTKIADADLVRYSKLLESNRP